MRVSKYAWAACVVVASSTGSASSEASTTCAPEFASQVLDYWYGWDPNPAGTNPSNILGNNDSFFALGKGGGIKVAFSKAFSTSGNSAPDLCIKETGNNDCYYVCVKPDDNFTKNALHAAGIYPDSESGVYELGLPCGTTDLDIDQVVPGYSEGELQFSWVLLADDGSSGDGAEFEWVEAKWICSTTPNDGDEECYSSFATEVDSYELGWGADDGTDPNDALGDDPSDWFNTGKGGRIALSFPAPFSTSGDSQADLCIDEGGGSSYADCYTICVKPADDFTKDALHAAGIWSSNGYYEVGFACGDKNLDLDAVLHGFDEGELSFTSIMIVDDGNEENGAEVSRIEAKFICPDGGDDCESRFATEVLSFHLGKDPTWDKPATNALGDNDSYYSPGGGGKIELGFGDPLSTSGDSASDLCVTEKGDNDCYYVALKPANDVTHDAMVAAGLHESPAGFYKLGKFCGHEEIDIDSFVPGFGLAELMFTSVHITDDNPNSSGGDGLELQAVEAKFVCPGMTPAKLGDFVFEDTDGDGEQDSGEAGVPGVTVTLFDANSQPVGDSIETGIDGRYEFCVTPGTYFVCFDLPDGYLFSPKDSAADDVDSDADPGTGCTEPVTLGPGEVNHRVDAGVIPNQVAKLGDFVFEDKDADGTQDSGEPGVAGVLVTLLDGSGAPTGDAMSTGSDGKYLFCVPPGTYIVRFDLPAGFEFTHQNMGDDDLDSDADPISGRSDVVMLASGEENLSIDAGLVAVAKLGDFVFEDKDADGVQEAGEPGVPNVVVNLLDGNGNSAGQQTMTDGEGRYQFCVDPGTYIVEFVAPDGTDFTHRDIGDDALDSDADETTGRSSPVTVQSGEINLTIDAGIVAEATLGDFLFIDADRDGIQDPNEVGIGGVDVCLIDFDTQLELAQTTTGPDGKYLFLVDPGCYQVRFKVTNPLYAFTLQKIGGDDELDSDVNASGVTSKVVVVSGDHITSVDAGVIINNCAGTAFLSQSLPACGLPNDPVLEVSPPLIGSIWTLKVSTPGLAPNSLAILLLSVGPPQNIPLPLSPCTLYVNPTALLILDIQYTDENGEWVRQIKIPPMIELAGVEFTTQVRICDPTHTGPIPGFPDFFSNAYHVKLGCP